jgi:hypothetical protein
LNFTCRIWYLSVLKKNNFFFHFKIGFIFFFYNFYTLIKFQNPKELDIIFSIFLRIFMYSGLKYRIFFFVRFFIFYYHFLLSSFFFNKNLTMAINFCLTNSFFGNFNYFLFYFFNQFNLIYNLKIKTKGNMKLKKLKKKMNKPILTYINVERRTFFFFSFFKKARVLYNSKNYSFYIFLFLNILLQQRHESEYYKRKNTFLKYYL